MVCSKSTPVTKLVIVAFVVLINWQMLQHLIIPALGRPLTMEKILVVLVLAVVPILMIFMILDII